LPRFDNEGFNPEKRINNDSRDRSVPADENYYKDLENAFGVDLSNSGNVVDRQGGYTDINSYLDNFDASARQVRSTQQYNRSTDVSRRATAKPPKAPKKRRVSTGKKIALGLIALVLVICIAGGAFANSVLGKITYDKPHSNKYVSAGDLMQSKDVKNILLLGVDARPDEESETSRADSMMLISIDKKHGCIKMTSFLRDTWVYIPAHEGEQRLNAASSYDGYNGVVDTIEYNFGVKIDGYVVADFEMFKVLVDSIGGVTVNVTKKEAKEVNNHPKRYGKVKLKAGKHKLNGKQALAYCRIRKIDTDFMRTKRQRTVMQSILSEVKKGNPLKLAKMASNSAEFIETSLTKAQLMSIGVAAISCVKGDMLQQRVPFEHTWDYANKNGASVIAINVEKNKEQLIDYIYNKTAAEIKAEQKED